MKYFIVIISLIFLFCVISCANDIVLKKQLEYVVPEDCVKSNFGHYSYQSHIDPQEITNTWIELKNKHIFRGPSTIEMYFKNPDEHCKNKILVSVFLVYKGAFIGFSYLCNDNKIYLYIFDKTTKCYKGKELEDNAKYSFKKKFFKALGFRSV